MTSVDLVGAATSGHFLSGEVTRLRRSATVTEVRIRATGTSSISRTITQLGVLPVSTVAGRAVGDSNQRRHS